MGTAPEPGPGPNDVLSCPPVVCLVASAGGLEALGGFFTHVPRNSGAAFLVLQHFPPDQPCLLPELLASQTALPCRLGEPGLRVAADQVLVLRHGMEVAWAGPELQVVEDPEAQGSLLPGDQLLRSVAACRGAKAAGVVLSGTGTDGAEGLRAIQEQGGRTYAQEPSAAAFAGMPSHAIDLEVVDCVAPLEELPWKILEALDGGGQARPQGEALQAICAVLARKTEHDFSQYKAGTLQRRINHRMHATGTHTLAGYLTFLEASGEEAQALLGDLLIGVTEFFRDPEAFVSLGAQLLPELTAWQPATGPLRVWAPGCCTGEEAYSLAMTIREHLDALGQARPVRIFATDIDTGALVQAKAGRYGEPAMRNVSSGRRARFFTQEGSAFRVVKELRDMCVFSMQNLVRDPPFSSLHLIVCRNVFIYLQPELQRRLIPIFHFALRPKGLLFLGSAEGLNAAPVLFDSVDKANRIYRRRDGAGGASLGFSLTEGWRPQEASPSPARAGGKGGAPSPHGLFERMLLEEYVPASAVVNEQGEVLYCAGRIGRFLNPALGVPSHNLLQTTHGSLRRELRALLAQAAGSRKREALTAEVRADAGMGEERLRLSVRPMPGLELDAGVFAVVLEPLAPLDGPGSQSAGEGENPLLDQLDLELRATRAELRATVEELGSTSEAFRASNEELHASNEELQVSQEELQSVNEELVTINQELQQKIGELRAANSDLQNLFVSTGTATLFLDTRLCITRFTPATQALYRLVEGDLGRPIGAFLPAFEGADLPALAAEVLASHEPQEAHLRSKEGDRSYVVRLLPYRTAARAVTGVVATFTDLTAIMAAHRSLAENEARQRQLFQGMVNGYAHCRMAFEGDVPVDFLYLDTNRAFHTQTGLVDVVGKWVSEAIPGIREADPDLFERYGRVVRTGHPERFEIYVEALADWFDISVYRPREGEFVAVFDVVSERKLQEAALRSSEQDLQRSQERQNLAMQRSHTGVWEFNLQDHAGYRNQEHAEIFGYPSKLDPWSMELFLEHVLPEDRPEARRHMEAGMASGTDWSFQCRIRRVDGEQRWLQVAGGMADMGPEQPRRVAGIVQDITDQKRAEEEARRSEERFALAFQACPDALAITGAQDGIYRLVNEAFTRIVGYTPEEVIGRSARDLDVWLDYEDRGLWAAELKARGMVEQQAVRFRKADGTLLTSQVSSRLASMGGEPVIVSVIRDITEQLRQAEEKRLLEAEVEHMQRMEGLGRLAGGVAHDVNNVLAAIFSMTQVLRGRHTQDQELDEALAIVELAATRGRDLVKALNGFVRKGVDEPQPLNLNDLVRQEVAILEHTLRQKFRLVVDLEEPLPMVVGLTGVLGSALMNLCVNAVDAMPEGGTLTLRTRHLLDGQVQLRVEDTGAGMPPDILKKAMEPFFTTKAFGMGTGLGLAMVVNTVRSHGGTFSLLSEPGQGTQALIHLPVATLPPQEIAPAALVETALATRHILLVDDDELLRATVPLLLRMLGQEVTVVDSGAAALAWLEGGGCPDLVLLDMSMPGMSGPETLVGLRRTLPTVPVLIATGVLDAEVDAILARDARVLAIAKPFSLTEIQIKLAELAALPG